MKNQKSTIVKFKFEYGVSTRSMVDEMESQEYPNFIFTGTGYCQYNCPEYNPEDLMDNYNDWCIEEGNEAKKDLGDCVGFEYQ